MRLADADHGVAGDAPVRVAERVRLRRLRSERDRVALLDAVDPSVVEARGEDRAAAGPDGAAAVLVHTRAGVEAGLPDVDTVADERRPAAFGRALLEPEEAGVVEVDDREPEEGLSVVRELLDRDRRSPGAVRCDRLRHTVLLTGQNTYGTSDCAPSAYQTPNTRLTTPSAGASRPNERRTRGRESVRPKRSRAATSRPR